MFKRLIVKIVHALTGHHIPYMIIGGQAVLLYGTPRLTKDIDITLGVMVDRLPEIVKISRSIKLSIIPKNYRNFAARTMVLPALDKTSGIRIDFIFSFTRYEQQAINHARHIALGKTMARFASAEDIIIHKIFAGRPRDLEDARSILIKKTGLDLPYIRRWLKEFTRSSESHQDFLKTFTGLLKNY